LTFEIPADATPSEYPLTATATAAKNTTVSKESATPLTVVHESRGPPPIIADHTPSDPDNDGSYEDVNGDGRLTTGDVQALFANLNKATKSPSGYDMNGDGRVTTGDVQALFASL
jgi:hypothetical protein